MNERSRSLCIGVCLAATQVASAQYPRVDWVYTKDTYCCPGSLSVNYSAWADDTRLLINAPNYSDFDLELYDISLSGPPQLVASIQNVAGGVDEYFGFVSDTLWVVYSGGAYPIDYTDPSNPGFGEFVGVVASDVDGSTRYVEFVGDRLHVFDSPWFGMYDFSDPSNVTELGRFRYLPDTLSAGAYVAGDRLYAYERGPSPGRFLTWDISDMAAPVLLSSTEALNAYAGNEGLTVLSADGNLLAIAKSGSADLAIVDVADPMQPAVLSQIESAAVDRRRVHIRDQVLYVISSRDCGHWTTFDVSDPSNPVDRGGVDFEGAALPRFESLNGARPVISTTDANGFPTFFLVGDLDVTSEELDSEFDIYISGQTEIAADATSYQGVTIEGADVFAGPSGSPIAPGLVTPPCGGTTGHLSIEGNRELGSIVVIGGGSLTMTGSMTTESMTATDGATVVVNGRLITDDLNLTNGSTLTHDAEATTEAP